MAAIAEDWPLVGRDAELRSITLARTDKACRGVVVSAAAGVGKSRLAREAQRAAHQDGALVSWVQATRSAATLPLGAFAGVLPDEVRSDDTLELILRGSEALLRRAASRPLVLTVDDAQLLDPVSAALVLHLASEGGVFVLATVRTGEPCPDAIVSLWKDAGARRIELQRLSDDAIARLVEQALGGPVEQRALRWVVERSQGNALFARELVASEALVHSRGLWRLPAKPEVSGTLIELVGERLSELEDEHRRLLELLALGEPLRLNEVLAHTGHDALEAAEARGLIALEQADYDEPLLRLAHPLYGDALRAGLPQVRARGLRLQLATTFQARAPLTPDDALRAARVLLDANEPIPPALQLDAARAANLAGDPDLGAELAEQARQDGAGLPATLLLARAHTARKRFADAEALLAAHEPDVTPDTAVDYLEQRTQALFWGLNRPKEAAALLTRARDWWPDAQWRRRLEPLRLGFAGVAPDALEHVLAQPAEDPLGRRISERRLAVSLFFAGQTEEAAALAERHRPAIPLRNYGDALALGIRRLIGMETGADWAALDADMATTLREGVRANDHEAAGHGALGLGYLELLRGRPRDAARWLTEAELHFERQDTFGNLIHARALRVGVELAAADHDAALEAHAALQATLGERDPLSSQVPYVARAEGWAALARREPQDAQARLLAAAKALDAMPVYAAQLTYEAFRAGATDVAPQLAALAARTDARLPAAYARHAHAHGNGDALTAAADEFLAIGARRYALEATVGAAEAYLRDHQEDAARRAATLARELHEPDQGTPPPAILVTVAVSLTPRETQLIELASAGLSNADIADRLVLSVRTVESHIYRAMQKLGVSDRRDL